MPNAACSRPIRAVYESGHPVKLTKSAKTNRAEFLFLFIASIAMTTMTNPDRLLDVAFSKEYRREERIRFVTHIAKMNCDVRLSKREKKTLNTSVAAEMAQPTSTVCHRSITNEVLLRLASP